MKCIASVCGSRRWGQNSVYLDLESKLSEKKSKWCSPTVGCCTEGVKGFETPIRHVFMTAVPLEMCNNRCITNDFSNGRSKIFQTIVQFAYFITTAGF